jgi:hypothetical protein
MPWTARDAQSHNKRARTPHQKKVWASAANAALKEYGDDATAIRVANAALHRTSKALWESLEPILVDAGLLKGRMPKQKVNPFEEREDKSPPQSDGGVRDQINAMQGAVGLPGHALNTTRPILSQ